MFLNINWMTYLTGETASLSLQSMALGTLTPVDRKLPRWVALQFCDAAPKKVPRNSDPVTSKVVGERGGRPVLDEDMMLEQCIRGCGAQQEGGTHVGLTAHVGEVVQLEPIGHVGPGVVLLHHLVRLQGSRLHKPA